VGLRHLLATSLEIVSLAFEEEAHREKGYARLRFMQFSRKRNRPEGVFTSGPRIG